MPRSTMKVALIRHTLSPEEVVALGARLCYSRATVDSLQQRVSRDDQSEFVSRILSMGHESVLEHASFTFAMEGVSRVLLAQITRHRLASFSVQSQRYVSYEKGFGYIVPPKIEALGEDAVAEFERQMDTMHQWYTGWQEKLGAGEGGNEDARFVLPGACETRMMVTMNVRELRHFFSLRMCSRRRRCTACAWKLPRRCLRTRGPDVCAARVRKGKNPAARQGRFAGQEENGSIRWQTNRKSRINQPTTNKNRGI